MLALHYVGDMLILIIIIVQRHMAVISEAFVAVFMFIITHFCAWLQILCEKFYVACIA